MWTLSIITFIKPLINHFTFINPSNRFSSVQSLSRVRLFATPWIAARQASLSITNSWSSQVTKHWKYFLSPNTNNSFITSSPIIQEELWAWKGQTMPRRPKLAGGRSRPALYTASSNVNKPLEGLISWKTCTNSLSKITAITSDPALNTVYVSPETNRKNHLLREKCWWKKKEGNIIKTLWNFTIYKNLSQVICLNTT